VPYGRIIEAARAHARSVKKLSPLARFAQRLIFERLIQSRAGLQLAGAGLYLYQTLGLQRLVRATGVLKPFRRLHSLEALTPSAETPFFFTNIGKTFPAIGERRYRVAFLAGCIANVAFSRLNEATVRVLQRNGCEVVIPPEQSCCGALHLHSGYAAEAQLLAKNNIDAVDPAEFDAIITNAAGCGSTLKEYDHLLSGDEQYAARARAFCAKVKDVCEFLASIDLNPAMEGAGTVVTYQDSCHLAHGQKIRVAPRKLLQSIPGLEFREMPLADVCCGSAGIYNVVENQMAMQILETKMANVAQTKAPLIATANPGCMLQLRAGARLFGRGEQVAHVVEVLDEAYRRFYGTHDPSHS
jgi:glycolate oxidase iron-sulfur subunit